MCPRCPCAHMAAAFRAAGVSLPVVIGTRFRSPGDVTRGSATLAVADPNFEGRSVAVGDPLEGRAVCACAQTPVLLSSAGLGSTLGAPQFRPFPGAAPTRGPRPGELQQRHPSAVGAPAALSPPGVVFNFFPLACSAICPRTVTTTASLLWRPSGLPYRFAYASRPHSGPPLSLRPNLPWSPSRPAIAAVARPHLRLSQPPSRNRP